MASVSGNDEKLQIQAYDYTTWFSVQNKLKSSQSKGFGLSQEEKDSYADKIKQNKTLFWNWKNRAVTNIGLSRIQRSSGQISTIFELSHVYLSSIAGLRLKKLYKLPSNWRLSSTRCLQRML